MLRAGLTGCSGFRCKRAADMIDSVVRVGYDRYQAAAIGFI